MNNFRFLVWYLNLVIYLSICFKTSVQLKCKDEADKDVDWYINYKIPKISAETKGSDLYEGTAYASLTSESSDKWTLSSFDVQAPKKSMLSKTWEEFKNAKKDGVSYLFYNDDPPPKFSTHAVGHMKGILAFDDKFGFWLMHTMPKFGKTSAYEYPLTATENGQTAICVTFKTSELNDICNHLLFANPNIYEKYGDAAMMKKLDENASSIFTKKPSFVSKAPFTKVLKLQSAGGQIFRAFAKDNQIKIDIYSDLIAPNLETSLIVSSWRRGVGTFLKPYCKKGGYTVVDVVSNTMNFTNKDGKKSVFFKSSEDHSKWAISTGSTKKWVCLGDLNRMKSQSNRGGGAMCMESNPAWKAFNSMISDVSQCGTSLENSSAVTHISTFYLTLCIIFAQFVVYASKF